MKISFPDDFLWGSATSSYQIEGGNSLSDWHSWERKKNLEKCGNACDFVHHYSDDIFIANSLGHNSFRLSIEWSRIFPQCDSLDVNQLSYYHNLISELIEAGIKPVVTLHHFTNPAWFIAQGGWCNPRSVDYFLQYVRTVVSYFSKHVKYWITFNEPLVYLYHGFITGLWPPGERSAAAAIKALRIMMSAHLDAYREIRSFYEDPGEVNISIAKHMRIFTPCFSWNFGQNHFFSFIKNRVFNISLLDYLVRHRCIDFIGLNYYCREFVKPGIGSDSHCTDSHHATKRNALGWHIYPQGLLQILRVLKRYGTPVIITENGTAAGSDDEYYDYMYTHIIQVARALQEGVDVRGYFWWSLLDNFEWDKGFAPRFGLLAVDYENASRSVRPFALRYKKICEDNALTLEDM